MVVSLAPPSPTIPGLEGALLEKLWRLEAAPRLLMLGHRPRRECDSCEEGFRESSGQRFPWFAERLGSLVTSQGNHVGLVGERIVAFPVEHHPLENPDLVLIARSARELVALADAAGYAAVVLPRPGCGGGGLEWPEVSRVLAPILDDRFLVVALPPAARLPGAG
jgi:hypothetical protein